jgi:hypothetical protein
MGIYRNNFYKYTTLIEVPVEYQLKEEYVMSFQAYMDAVVRITQKSLEDIKNQSDLDGILKKGLKATEFIFYLNQTYGLGRGHSMALWKYFIDHDWIMNPVTTIKPKE